MENLLMLLQFYNKCNGANDRLTFHLCRNKGLPKNACNFMVPHTIQSRLAQLANALKPRCFMYIIISHGVHHNKRLPKNVYTSLYGVLSLPDDVVLIRACRSVCVATKKDSELRKGPSFFLFLVPTRLFIEHWYHSKVPFRLFTEHWYLYRTCAKIVYIENLTQNLFKLFDFWCFSLQINFIGAFIKLLVSSWLKSIKWRANKNRFKWVTMFFFLLVFDSLQNWNVHIEIKYKLSYLSGE